MTYDISRVLKKISTDYNTDWEKPNISFFFLGIFWGAVYQVHCSDFGNGTQSSLLNQRLVWDVTLVVEDRHAVISTGSAWSTSEWLFACSHFSSQQCCHDLWLWFGLCAQWMLLNKKAHSGDWGGVGLFRPGSQSVEDYYTCLHKPHPGFCSITLVRFSVDLDMSVKDRLKADSNPLCRQQNETALWNLSESKIWVMSVNSRFVIIQWCNYSSIYCIVLMTLFHRNIKI